MTEAQEKWLRQHTNFEVARIGVAYEAVAELYGDGRISEIFDGRTETRPGPSMVVVGVPAKT